MTIKSSPPFTALRAIEAAVRHRSYTWAAKELAVTHSAVSQSIKRLEGELGTKLFERRGGAMEPSAAAVQLASAYADAAGVLGRLLERVAESPLADQITITMPASFGRLWFSPRMPRLSSALPDLTVEIRTSMNMEAVEESNLVISVGPPPREGWSTERLCEIMLTPLCSPAFSGEHNLERPLDVLSVPLIAERGLPWSLWLEGAGIGERVPRQGHLFDDSSMMLDAAARGEGLALSQRMLAQPYLAAGSLIAPFEFEMQAGQQLFASWRGQGNMRVVIDRFMSWLRSEIPIG